MSDIITDTIWAKNFTRGRAEPVRLVVWHSTESGHGPGAASNVAKFFAGRLNPSVAAPQASAHYVVGPDAVIQCVKEEDKAWHVGYPANEFSVGVEHTANCADLKDAHGNVTAHGFTAEDWARPEIVAMLDRSAALFADICIRHGLPAAFVDHDGILAGASGITTHAEISKAYPRGSNHTDPGKLFPMAEFIAKVQAAMAEMSEAQQDPAPADDQSPVQR